MGIRLLYLAQTLLWMRGILQLEMTESRKRYALALAVLGAFFLWEGTIGFWGNDPPVWMVTTFVFLLFLLKEKPLEILIKYLFSTFYIGLFSEPIRAFFSICREFSVIGLEKEQENFVVDVLLIFILVGITLLLRGQRRWRIWIQNIQLKYYGIGFLAAFCASGVGAFSSEMIEEMPRAAFVFYRIISMLLEEMVYLSGIFIAYLADLNRRYQKESVLKGELLEQSKEHFITLERQIATTHKIRHDIKFHLGSVRTLMKKGEQEEALNYLDTIVERTDVGKVKIPDLGNRMINAVLEGQASQMPEGVRLECSGALRGDVRVDDFDLCTIFANLVSNAREACEKIEQSEKKILIQLKQYSAYLVIMVENPMEGSLDVTKIGKFTSKKNAADHGLGLLNVMEVVEKNGGSVSFSADNGIFRATVRLRCEKA